jgi:glycosyltransferase involved in cell wall biosynthesis
VRLVRPIHPEEGAAPAPRAELAAAARPAGRSLSPTRTRSTHEAAGPRGPLRLGVLATHPIQYHAPLYRALADTAGVELTVYYAHRPTPVEQGVGFDVPFNWDGDLLGGYRHVWLRNEADVRRAVTSAPFRDGYLDYDTPGIANAVTGEPFDAFLFHGWRTRSDWQGVAACRAARIPALVRGDSQLRDDPLVKRIFKRAPYMLLMRRFAGCLSVGQRSGDYFRYYGARHIVPSPHFVDNDAFAERAAAARPRRETMRGRWGVSRSAVAMLYVGKLVPKKRPLDLIRAMRGMYGVHLIVVGDGALRREAQALAQKLAVPATFTGFLNQIALADAYAAADVLILPSTERETWGLVVNEAMASGRPAIVSDAAGCTPDLIHEGVTGYSYPAGDMAALRQCVARFVADPASAERMGEAATAHVAKYSAATAAAGVVRAAMAAAGTAPWP